MTRDPLVVTFADSAYLPLLQLWMQQLREFGLHRVTVFSLDAGTQAWCQAHGITASALPWNGSLADLWVRRIQIFTKLLDAGEEIIHSDIDAIWVRNPLQFGAARNRSEDLIFSQGTVWPIDVHDHWGFVLCCGWFWAKPVPAAQAFFRALEADVRVSGDDQISVNRLLVAAGARWSQLKAGDYQLRFRDRWVQCWSEPNRASVNAGPLTVALLPQSEFQRLPEETERAVVKHWLTPKNCGQKLLVLRQLGVVQ
jgi:hypothetical protein